MVDESTTNFTALGWLPHPIIVFRTSEVQRTKPDSMPSPQQFTRHKGLSLVHAITDSEFQFSLAVYHATRLQPSEKLLTLVMQAGSAVKRSDRIRLATLLFQDSISNSYRSLTLPICLFSKASSLYRSQNSG